MNVIPYPSAVKILSEAFGKIVSAEAVPVRDAAGRISAADVFSPEPFPPFDRSSVDGYALSHRDSAAASAAVPAILSLKGEVRMGNPAGLVLSPGECAYVPTGGMLPEGADAVLMIEDAEKSADEIYVSKSLHVGENVLRTGADIAAGERVLTAGERMTAARAGVLSSVGITSVRAFKRLDYYVISTGDELVPPGAKCEKGKIRDTNTVMLVSELSKIGNVKGALQVSDDYPELRRAVSEGLSVSDVVILSGGSSVGKADYTAKLFSEFGRVLFGGVAVKPGKPTLAAETDGRILIGLPGHPMAALTSYRLIVLRALLNACGSDLAAPVVCRAERNFPGGKGRSAFIPVKLINRGDHTAAEPLFYQSGMLSAVGSADGFALLDDSVEGVPKGAPLEVYGIGDSI